MMGNTTKDKDDLCPPSCKFTRSSCMIGNKSRLAISRIFVYLHVSFARPNPLYSLGSEVDLCVWVVARVSKKVTFSLGSNVASFDVGVTSARLQRLKFNWPIGHFGTVHTSTFGAMARLL